MKHHCKIQDAPRFLDWIRNRKGVAHWKSCDLSNLERSWSTPATTEDGKPFPCPHWGADKTPEIITDPKDITVFTDREVKRFRVHVRMGSQGLSLKLTDASSKRVRREIEKAGKGAYNEFDYDTQECVIMAPDKSETLEEWANRQPPPNPLLP